ncbi:S-acyl fatty acid synthase thioesterase, medium chain [Heterocephalus glaber]|uniref:S-acyl fatty acid synthase thioesterase, medium chain n=1 Tax=Heterocephalus glaber TaxID=10181 RepID=A0AAX6RQV4_HETGA|nr:S-acyl fatty acid synthase thioesterase, medium chain [Heterocephalus glaber]
MRLKREWALWMLLSLTAPCKEDSLKRRPRERKAARLPGGVGRGSGVKQPGGWGGAEPRVRPWRGPGRGRPAPSCSLKCPPQGFPRNEKVFNCLYAKPKAIFRLICFPWAGAGSLYFAKWGQKIYDSLEVYSVRLAGRESRTEEPFANDIDEIVDEIVYALLPVVQDKPFAFFGHSLGSYIAFMTALHLKEKYKLEPLHFFASSATPPYSKAKIPIPSLHELSEEQVKRYLIDLGGIPKSLTDNQELLKQTIPMILADINILSKYSFDTPQKAVLSCDFTCFVGSEDITKDMEAWKIVTSGTFDLHVLPGNHFYLLEPANEHFITNYITKCLELSLLANF